MLYLVEWSINIQKELAGQQQQQSLRHKIWGWLWILYKLDWVSHMNNKEKQWWYKQKGIPGNSICNSNSSKDYLMSSTTQLYISVGLPAKNMTRSIFRLII